MTLYNIGLEWIPKIPQFYSILQMEKKNVREIKFY